MFDDVIPLWRQLVQSDGAKQRRVNDHPLSLWFGANDSSKPIFFLITAVEPNFPRLADIVSVEKGKRGDGRWTVVLTLHRQELADSFMGLCVELMRRSSISSIEATSRAIFFATLDDWRSLLSVNKGRRLSPEEVRGLCAEIWFAVFELSPKVSAPAALIAWQGPYGAPQDFQTFDGDMFEVKAIHSASRAVKISSVDQLDPPSEGLLELVLVIVDEVPIGTHGAFTLAGLIGEFRSILATGAGQIDELEHRLDALQFDVNDAAYDEVWFSLGGARYYRVGSEFPRVRRASVPLGVAKVKYELDIAAFSDFVTEGL